MATLHTKSIVFFIFGVMGVAAHADFLCMQNSTLSSTFKHNLASALQDLASDVSSSPHYATTTRGSGEDQVRAKFHCRANQSSQACMQCLTNATTLLLSQCPISTAAHILLDACYLHYDIRSTFATVQQNLTRLLCNTNGIASSTFKHNLASALEDLTSLSSYTRYAITTKGSGEDQLHAMFQCRGDQSSQACMQCLVEATAFVRSECPFSDAATIQLHACYFRYDSRTFAVPDFKFQGSGCSSRRAEDLDSLQGIQQVVKQVISLAPKNGGYAVAHESNGFVCIAQCLGYLSEMECAQCLSMAANYTSDFDSCTGFSHEQKDVHLSSCYYQYEKKNDILSASMTPIMLEHQL